jgi:hypothetical protein
MSTFTLPIHVKANARGHTFFARFGVKAHREAAFLAGKAAWLKFANRREAELLAAGLVVKVTRIAPRQLDGHDNLRTSIKPIVDGLTDALGLKNDRDPRITWAYDQVRGGVREYGVRIAFSPRAANCPTCGQPTTQESR